MDDAAFWALIEDRSAIALELALAKLPPEEIVAWSARFDAYVAALDRWDLKLATHVILDGWYDPRPVSAWLISRGRAAVEAAIADPDKLASLDRNDELVGVAQRAYRRACQADLPDHPLATLDQRWPADCVSRLEAWTSSLIREHLPRLYKRHLAKRVARSPLDWDGISRSAFWRVVAEANGDLSALATRLDTPQVAVGFERWRRHFYAALERRVGIRVAAHVFGVELRSFVSWLLLQGERVVDAAIEDADTLADHVWVGTASRALEEIVPGAAERLRVFAVYWRVRIPEESWPGDLPETAETILGSDMLARWFPKLAARYAPPPPPERFVMPRAAWQIELAGRNRWWGLAWDIVERETSAMELDRFWDLVDKLAWPSGSGAWVTASPLRERLAFVMRFHERVATYGDGEAELAIAGGRAAYEARRTIGAKRGFTAFVDELRRSPPGDLPLRQTMRVEDAAGHDGAVVHHRGKAGFIAGGSIILHDGVVPIPASSTRRPYSPKATFAIGDEISHPTFGEGKVVEKLSGKIKIRFEDGQTRVLAAK